MREQIFQTIKKGVMAIAVGARRAGVWCVTRAVRYRFLLLLAGLVGFFGYTLLLQPPVRTVKSGELLVRNNYRTGISSYFQGGSVWVLPGIHDVRRFSLRDQLYKPQDSSRADGPAPFQSSEGLSIGMDISVRYALDPSKVAIIAERAPDDIGREVIAPSVQGVVYKILPHYSVREIFSSRRQEIQQTIEQELKPLLAADGLVLRRVQIGNIDLPSEFRNGMDALLAAELESEKMKYTLELKGKQVQEHALEAEAEKVMREKAAEASASEQVIAAKAQEEAMKHVLPFKQKQIEQRQFEAEADKVSRIKSAEAQAQARVIEAEAEAASRQKLADAEVYRLDRIGKTTSEQMEREGALISKHPLLIQKTMADKLSDKVSVIIAPPSTGGFVASNLIGGNKRINANADMTDSDENGEE